MADYSANIAVAVKNIESVTSLAKAVADVQANVSKLNKTALNPFKGQITALKQINTLLKSNEELLNRIAAKKIATIPVSQGQTKTKQRVDTKADEKRRQVHKESLEILARQVNVIREAAKGSSNWSDVTLKLVRAQAELKDGNKANLTLIRTLLRNAQSILKTEKDLTKAVSNRADTRAGEAASARNVTQEIKELADFEKGVNKFLKDREALRRKEAAEIQKIEKTRDRSWQKGTGLLKNLGGKVDGAFGNAVGNGLKALENGAIRGAAAGIGIVGAQALTAASNVSVFGNSLDFLQGPIGQTVQAIAELTGQWGLAAVAAAAFAPLLPSIGKGIVKGLPAFGQLGQVLADVTGISERARPALDSLGRSFDTLMGKRDGSFLANGLFNIGPNSLDGLKFPDLNAQANAAANNLDSKLTLTALPEAIKAFNAQLQVASDKLQANHRITKGWVTVLEDGSAIIKQMKIENATQDLSRSMRELNTLNDQRVKQAQDIAEYYGTANTNLQEAIRKTRELTGLRATQPALRPAGMSDSDVVQMIESKQMHNAARPFAPASNPGMSPVSLKALNDEAVKVKNQILRQKNMTEEIKQSWRDIFKFAGYYRQELSNAAKLQVANMKTSQTSLLNSKLRLEYFKKQNAELQKQKGLMALVARQVAKGMDAGGAEGLKQGKQKFGENLALGVGFPLLFGGGPGSVVGSGIGSLFGDGFGGQILGGAIGQVLDQAAASAAKLGNALQSLNIDSLREDGIAFTGQLQEQVTLLKAAGKAAAARDFVGEEIYRQTGDMDGDQLKLAAGSINELQKAWNGLMAAAKVALGTLLAPFIQVLTLALRGIQALIGGWNMLVSLVGKAGKFLLQLVGVSGDDLYNQTRQNTAEYETQNAALLEQIRLTARLAEMQAAQNAFDIKDVELEEKITNGFSQGDREYNRAIRYEQELIKLVKDRFLLEEEESDAIGDIRKKYEGKVDPSILDKRIEAEKLKYEQMYEEIAIKRRKIDAGYLLDVEKMLNQRAQAELKQAEAAQQLRRRGLSLNRQAEDAQLDTERTVVQLRRQGAAIERSTAELRESIEDRILSKQVETQRMQLDISRRREQLAINEADLAARTARSFTGAIGEDLGNELLDSAREVIKVRAEGEADIRKKNLEMKLDIEQIDLDARKFELDIAKKVEQIKRAIADYELSAADAELKLSRKAEDLKIAAADYAVVKRKEEIALMDEAAARIATSQLAQQVGGGFTNTVKEGSTSQIQALAEAANKLQISAKDLAAIISYETGGTFDPNIKGGAGGNYEGLIQFGPEERKTYGVKHGMSFEDQITGPVVEYLKDRFAGVGRSTAGATLSDLYRTVNGGNPNAPLTKHDGNGSIAEHIQKIKQNHGARASEFLGGNVEVLRAVKDGPVDDQQERSTASSAVQPEIDQVTQRLDAARANADQARSGIQPIFSGDTDVTGLLDQYRQQLEIRKEVLRLEGDISAQEAKQRLRDKELADLEKTQQLITATKQPIVDIIRKQKASVAEREREAQLIRDGMIPAQVEQTLEIEKQVELQAQKFNGAIALVEARVAELNAQENQTEAVRAEVALLEQKLGLLRAGKRDVQDQGQNALNNVAALSEGSEIDKYLKTLQGELNNTDAMIVSLARNVESEISSSMTNAVTGLIDGTKTAQDAFASMFKGIGAAFIQMATQMIAKALIMKALNIVMPGAGGGGWNNPNDLNSIIQLPGFADGGRPEPNSVNLIGERGPELLLTGNESSRVVSSSSIFGLARQAMSSESQTLNTERPEQAESDDKELAFAQARSALQTSNSRRSVAAAETKQEIEMAELISGTGSNIRVEVDTVNVGGMDVVSQDQLRVATQQAASKARSDVFRDLRNRPSARRQVGV